jgi:large repetitive protein
MKKFLSAILIFASSFAYAQFANPSISPTISPISIPVNSNATLTATVANFGGGTDIVGNSIRATLTVGANAEIISIDPSSSANWILLNNTTGAGNTYRFKNVGNINDFDAQDIKVVVKGLVVSTPATILTNVTYIAGTNPLLSPAAPSASQGDLDGTDNNGTTSLEVIPSLVVNAVATIGATTVTAIPCKGESATLNASASGGANPMSYSLDGISYQSGTTFPITAGTYTVYGKDANNLVATTVITISEPAVSLSANASITTPIACNGGSAVVTVSGSGGTSPYASGTGTFSVIASGSAYSYTVVDANGCSANSSVMISQPSALSASASVVNASCNGGTGVVTISATGGTGAYTGTGAQAAQAAGTYTYTVTDANSCAATVSATIAEPTAVVASASVVNATCNGGTGVVTISATGGTGAYTGTGAQAAQVAGTYTYTVTDANSCAATVSATIAEPTAVVASASVANASCNGGTGVVTISATGGTGAYTGTGAQTAQVAGTYTYTVTDANSCAATVSATINQPTAVVASASVVNASCNGGTGVVTISATGGTGAYTGTGAQAAQIAGTYTYTVADANGCAATVSATIAEPTAVVASASVINASCNGGTGVVTISATGGTGAYTGTGAQAAQVAGTYTYTVTDANSCAATVSATINQPTAVVANAIVTNAIVCNGGSAIVTVTAAGGTSPYTSGTGTFSAIAGSQSFTVTDASGCTNTTTITITQPAMVTLTVPSNIAPTCFGRNNGSFKVLATVGVAPFTYSVAPTVLQSTPGQFNNVVAGSYTVNVSDANGCTSSTVVVVSQPAAVNVVATSVISPNCNGGTDGQISVITVGGVGPFTYTSAPVRTQPVAGTFINLNSTIYVITSTDANGCTKAFVLPLAQPTKVKVASITKVNPLCNGAANGSITATGTGGVGALTFNINAGSYGVGIFGSVGAGTYTVGVVDAKGCTGTSTTTLTQPTALTWYSVISTPPTGINANGSIVVSVSGGVGVKSYANNASAYQTSGTFSTLAAGTYTVTSKDVNNCIISTTVVLGSTAIVSGSGTSSSIATEAVTRWFPNPTEGMSSMLLNSSIDGSVELLNAQGSRIRLIEIPVNRGENTLSIDLSELPRGIYTAKVILEGKDVFVGKIERR